MLKVLFLTKFYFICKLKFCFTKISTKFFTKNFIPEKSFYSNFFPFFFVILKQKLKNLITQSGFLSFGFGDSASTVPRARPPIILSFLVARLATHFQLPVLLAASLALKSAKKVWFRLKLLSPTHALMLCFKPKILVDFIRACFLDFWVPIRRETHNFCSLFKRFFGCFYRKKHMWRIFIFFFEFILMEFFEHIWGT